MGIDKRFEDWDSEVVQDYSEQIKEARVNIAYFDTTLRDGAQSLPQHRQFRPGTKPIIAGAIAEVGIDVIEAGFPSTPKDFDPVMAVARTVGNNSYTVGKWRNGKPVGESTQTPRIAGLSPSTRDAIAKTYTAVSPAQRARLHVFIPTDAEHMKAKFKDKEPEDIFAMGRQAVAFATELAATHPDMDVEYSLEAWSTTETEVAERVIKDGLNSGATIINLPDTVGQVDPWSIRDMYKQAIGWVMQTNPYATISAHPHNDLGLAVANSQALVFAAADYSAESGKPVNIQLETTFCGVGERAGNADLFPIVAGIFKFSQQRKFPVPLEWQFNPNNAVSRAQTVLNETESRMERIARLATMGIIDFRPLLINRQSPIVGRDTNVHRSGIHSDGILKGGYRIYTSWHPTFWGHKNNAEHEDGDFQGTNGRLHLTR